MTKKLLGIDYGEKRVGVAISDDAGEFAFPREVLVNDKKLVSVIAALCREEGAGTIVLGESKTHTQEDNPIMVRVRALAEELKKETGLPIVYEPEFLTTAQARRTGMPREKRDASAAAIILQSYIDRQREK